MENRRAYFRTGLSRLYLPFYDALCAELPPEWQPYAGVRTVDQQDGLYAKGRTTFPIGPQFIVTYAKGGQSAHNYGCATDWVFYENGTLTWLSKKDPRWEPYVSAVRKVGLRPGVEFGDIDHNELRLTCDWPHVLLAFQQSGMTGAQQKIEESLV